MDFLKSLIFLCVLTSLPARAAVDYSLDKLHEIKKGWSEEGVHRDHCRASEEFIKTIEFLRKDQTIPEKEIRKIAEVVSRGCDGSAERFSKAYLLMKKSGLSFQKSVDVGLAMVRESPVTVSNFYEIFEKMYLGEFFDVNFQSSFEIAFELSKEFKGNLEFARNDFNDFSKFCMDHKKVGLSVTNCAKLAVRFARLSQYFPNRLFKDFNEIYLLLREDKRFGLSLQESLNLTEQILKNGPAAKKNFLQAFNYAVMKNGLNISGREALDFALRMAARSYKGEYPPIYPGEQMFQNVSQDETESTFQDEKREPSKH
ncbi:MAG: hypothetical protein AABZ31_05515 [Bdellovibrionota bacterium]